MLSILPNTEAEAINLEEITLRMQQRYGEDANPGGTLSNYRLMFGRTEGPGPIRYYRIDQSFVVKDDTDDDGAAAADTSFSDAASPVAPVMLGPTTTSSDMESTRKRKHEICAGGE